jgi:hypothetical protein
MADYITPRRVEMNAFMLATTMNRSKLFGPKLEPRGDRLVAIDTALEVLRDNYQGNAEQKRGFLLLVIREARNWLRNVQRKADSGKLGTADRHHKKIAIKKLVAEATDALIACTPGFKEAMEAYAQQKVGGAQQFQMKGLSGVYRNEGNLYRSGGKSQGKTWAATRLHNQSGYLPYDEQLPGHVRNRNINDKKQEATGLGLDRDVLRDVHRLIEKMMRGDVLFEDFMEHDFNTLGRYIDAREEESRVVYFSKMERLQHLKYIRDGKLYNVDETPFKTGRRFDDPSWAMDCYGNLFAGDAKMSDVMVNHSSYLAGKDVACAGLIETDADGTLTVIDNLSGHYKPTREHLHKVMSYLAEQGLNFDKATVRVKELNGAVKEYRASAWIRNINAPALGNRQFTLGGNR